MGRGIKGTGFMAKGADMASLFVAGKTLKEIGDLYGCSSEMVRQALKHLGINSSNGGSSVRSATRLARIVENREYRFQEKHKISSADWKSFPKKTRKAYITQRTNAKKRGISWEFNLNTWWAVWEKSGKWDRRGTGEGYCMARNRDEGPYAPGNVYICTVGQNFSDSWGWRPYNSRPGAGKKEKIITHWGISMTIQQWADNSGISKNALRHRLDRGWPLDTALSRRA